MARPMCESCGMPLKDGNKGKEADGADSDRYCQHCYAGGEFTLPHATVDEMRQMSITGMTESHWPRWLARLMTKNIHKLPRWQAADTSAPRGPG